MTGEDETSDMFKQSSTHYLKRLKEELDKADSLNPVIDVSQAYPANLQVLEAAHAEHIESRTVIASYLHDFQVAIHNWKNHLNTKEGPELDAGKQELSNVLLGKTYMELVIEIEEAIRALDARIRKIATQKSQVVEQNSGHFYSSGHTSGNNTNTSNTPPITTATTTVVNTSTTTTSTNVLNGSIPTYTMPPSPFVGSSMFSPPPFPPPMTHTYGGPVAFAAPAFMGYPSMMPSHLPEIKLPEFTGDLTQWFTWWQSYEAAVHSQPIRNVLKFTYLLSSLKGEAKTVIQNIAPRDDTYEMAIDILKKRFGNETVIVQTLLSELEKIPQAGNSTADIRRVYDRIESVLRQLSALKQSVNDIQTCRTIERKLPLWLQKEIYKEKKRNASWSLDDTRELINDRLLLNETVERLNVSSDGHQKQGYDRRQKHVHAAIKQNTRLFTGNTAAPVQTKGAIRRECAFCGFDHWSNQCRKYATLADRNAQVKAKKLCWVCLKGNHFGNECQEKVNCYHCGARHHQALCKKKRPQNGQNTQGTQNRSWPNNMPLGTAKKPGTNQGKPNWQRNKNVHATITQQGEDNGTGEYGTENGESQDGGAEEAQTKYGNFFAVRKDHSELDAQVFLLTTNAPVSNVQAPEKSGLCGILLDPGADTCLLSKRLVDRLQLEPVRNEMLSLSTVHQKERKPINSAVYQVGVKQRDGTVRDIYAYCVENLLDALPSIRKVSSWTDMGHGHKYQQSSIEPELLIGANYAYQFISRIGKKTPEGLVEIHTSLGPLFTGAATDIKNITCAAVTAGKCLDPADDDASEKFALDDEGDEDDKRIKLHFALENIGITQDSPYEQDDHVAWDLYVNSLQRIGKRYYGSWPLNTPEPCIPNMLPLCFGRLKSVVNRMTPEQLIAYAAVFQEYVDQDIMEIVTDPKEQLGPYVMYQAHHAVFKNNGGKGTTKVRPVLDCSAKPKQGDNSFNSILFRGPLTLQNLLGIVLRSRFAPILVICDICKAYLMIALHPADSELVRILFLRDINKPVTWDNIVVLRYKRVIFGSRASQFMLGAVLHVHLSRWNAPLAKDMLRSLYVDDLALSCQNTQDGLSKCREAKEILTDAEMKLAGFKSNDPKIHQEFADEPSQSKAAVLGIEWCIKTDTFLIGLPNVPRDTPVTKRFVLRYIGKTFDPAGWISPAILPAKCLFQKTWGPNRLDWNDLLPPDMVEKWFEITSDWDGTKYTFPRRIPVSSEDEVQLHMFSDANAECFACCAYLRIKGKQGYDTYLVATKCRLRPLKKITIPKMELLAAYIAAKLSRFLMEQLDLNIAKVVLHSDAKAVLYWLKNRTNEKSRFINNRLKYILESGIEEFRYVRSELNPSDVASRGTDIQTLMRDELYWKGPGYLRQPESTWDTEPFISAEDAKESEGTEQHGTDSAEHKHAFVVHNKITKESEAAYLMTTFGKVSPPTDTDGGKVCGILIDLGADITLITNSSAEKLRLKPLCKTTLNLNTVNVQNRGSKLYRAYAVRITSNDGSYEDLVAYGVDHISDALPHIDDVSSKDGEVTKLHRTSITPELLLGANYAYRFVQDLSGQHSSGLRIIRTRLGKILAGTLDKPIVLTGSHGKRKKRVNKHVFMVCMRSASKQNPGLVVHEALPPTTRQKREKKQTSNGVSEAEKTPSNDANSGSQPSKGYGRFFPVVHKDPQLVFDVERYSTWNKAVRVTAYVLRYLKLKVLDRAKTNFTGTLRIAQSADLSMPVSACEFQIAEKVLIRQAQIQDALSDTDMKKYGLFASPDGLIRCHTRMMESDLPASVKQPIWLPAKNRITLLIVMHYHSQLGHAETGHVMNELRQVYRMGRMRQSVKSIIYQNCFACRKRKIKPFARPPMAQLPADRFHSARCWEFISCDNFGPFHVRTDTNDMVKRYGMLIFCMKSRAIHIEQLDNLSTDECLGAFTRFIARRGTPRLVRSDNCTSYKCAEKHLCDLWRNLNQDQVFSGYLARHGIQWTYSTERAAWENGSAERLIGIAKKAIKGCIGRKIISDSQLRSIFVFAEGVVNSRPLTTATEENTCIRPLDLLGIAGAPGLPTPTDAEDIGLDPSYYPSATYNREQAVNHWRAMLVMTDDFWSRLYKEYLPTLRDSQPLMHRDPRCRILRSPMLGDIVHVYSDDCPKGAWPLGKILSMKQSRDNYIRTARVQMRDGTVLNRAISELYPLELQSQDKVLLQSEPEAPVDDATPIPTRRSTRKRVPVRRTTCAAIQAGKAVMRYPFYFLLVFIISATHAQKCSNDGYNLQRVASPACRTHGTAIYKLPGNKGHYCYTDIVCLKGHIQPANVSAECGTECKCDKEWHVACSFYSGKAARNSSASRKKIRHAFESLQPANFSTTLVTNGASNSAFVKVPKVELYDGSTFIIKQLNIVYRELLTDQVVCFGKGSVTGTPSYCEHHKCFANGTRLCHIMQAEAMFYHLPTGLVAIRGYGFQNVSIYGSTRSYPDPKCSRCKLECSEQGAILSLPAPVSAAQVCESFECHRRTNVTIREEFFFSPAIRVVDHEIRADIWNDGVLISQLQAHCKATAFCDNIRCHLCAELLFNPRCSPNIAAAMYFVLLYLGCIVILTVAKALYIILTAGQIMCSTGQCLAHVAKSIITNICRIVCLPVKCVFVVGRHLLAAAVAHRGQQTAVAVRNPRRKFKPLVFLTIICVLAGLAHTCGITHSITGNEKLCFSDDSGTLRCTFQETTMLNMQPKSPTCLLMQDSGARPMGTFKAQLKGLFERCNKHTRFHTKPFEVRVDSVKRCYNAGNTCIEDRCAKMDTGDFIQELADSMDFPGNSHCRSSCGSILCGCYHLTEGCLLYRFYAVETSNQTLEIFDCPSYETVAIVEAELTMGTDRLTHTFELHTGETETWSNIKLTLSSISQGKAPVLSQTFISNGREIGLKQGPHIETLTCNRTNVGFRNCSLPDSFCHCHPTQEMATCTCQDEKAYNLENDKLLPQFVGGIWLSVEEGRVSAQLPASNALVQVSLDGLSVQTEVEANTCTIKDSIAQGCFSCISGSRANITCHTNFGKSLAHVSCKDIQFSVLCTPEGHTETVHLMFAKASISEHCQVRCVASESSFLLQGNLHYVSEPTTSGTSVMPRNIMTNADYGNFWSFISEYMLTFRMIPIALGLLLAVIVLGATAYCVFTVGLPGFAIYRQVRQAKSHILIVGAIIITCLPTIKAVKIGPGKQHADNDDTLAEQLALISGTLLTTLQLIRAARGKAAQLKDDLTRSIIATWSKLFDGYFGSEESSNKTVDITEFVDDPDILESFEYRRLVIRDNHRKAKQIRRRIKRKQKRDKRNEIREYRETHCCRKRRCRKKMTCKGDKLITSSDEDSDSEVDWSRIKPCYCVKCYTGDVTRLKGGTFFGLYLTILSVVALLSNMSSPIFAYANIAQPEHNVSETITMFNAPRMRPPYGQQFAWHNGPREGWIRLSKQLKIDLKIAPGDETDGDLAAKLNDPNESQRILKLINCRRLSGIGRVAIYSAFGWDGPANETTSLDEPGKTVEEYYQDAGHALKAAQYRVLMVKEKKEDTELKQSPLEYTWTLAPITASKGEPMKPMPGWGKSKAGQNGSDNKGIRDTIKELTDIQALEFQGVKNAIENLTNMVQKEKELKAHNNRLEADNATQGKQLALKEAEVTHLRSIVNYYKEAAPKVQLPAHFIIERILDGGDKPTTVAGQKRKEEGGSSNEHKTKNARTC